MELQPLDINDLKQMLGEKDILIEQLRQAASRLEAEVKKLAPEVKEPAP